MPGLSLREPDWPPPDFPMTARLSSVDLFCRVVDNFGDIGVCWRLARQLAMEQGIAVRLMVDRPDVLHALVPAMIANADIQQMDGVTVQVWRDSGLRCDADLVIEAFACELPVDYLESMAARSIPPVWVNLEYLSAEPWVASHHGLPSPHPRLPLTKTFFFPGFTENTGGLLRERHIAPQPVHVALNEPIRVFAFTYDAACIDALCQAIAADARPARVNVSGPWDDKLKHWCGSQAKNALNASPVLEFHEFVPQAEFDALLAAHDLLLVRGEDSLVRALWSGRPFVWQLYRQPNDVHLAKLEAFLDWYSSGMSDPLRIAWQDFSRAWNGGTSAPIMKAWPKLRDHWKQWCAYAADRSQKQMQQPELASNLLSFFGKVARM
jgi:uncharacterized repeat protein (TIGR03837 family)